MPLVIIAALWHIPSGAWSAPFNLHVLADTSHPQVNDAFGLLEIMRDHASRLESEYIYSVSSSVDVDGLMNGPYIDFADVISWIYNYTVDNDGNEILQEYNDYEFSISYRDGFKALMAYVNPGLRVLLSPRESRLLDKATSVLAEIITPGMSDYQKVLAVHDYLVLNAEFDTRSDTDALPPESRTAEGVLIYGKGVCTSFVSCMSMFMGMLGIECINVMGVGASSPDVEIAHVWNKVKLDGDWYNIDVTWADPVPNVPNEVKYKYFNVTDAFLARDHRWDETVFTQSANAVDYNYFRYNNLLATDYAQFKEVIRAAILAQGDKREMVINVYVTDYDPALYEVDFIFDVLPDITRVTYTEIIEPEDEIVIKVYRD